MLIPLAVGLSVVQSVYVHDYCKSNQLISSLGLVVMIYQSEELIRTTVTLVVIRSRIRIPDHLGDFRRFSSVSHSHQPIFTTLAK